MAAPRTLVVAAIAIGAVVAAALLAWLPQEWRFVDAPLHAAIESVGGLSAIVIALLLQQPRTPHQSRPLPLALGFLAMGILDSFHALTAAGNGFVWLRSASSLAGGACFALVWMPEGIPERRHVNDAWLAGAVAIGAVGLTAGTLLAPDRLPALTPDGEFTRAILVVNLAAGLLFIAAAVRLYRDFRSSGSFEGFLLTSIAAMFGVAATLFPYSRLWDGHWWLWHLIRAAAYGAAMLFAYREHYGTVAELRRLLGEHQEAEAKLRDGEIRYRTIFEQSPEGILLIDPATLLPIEFNDRAAEQLGYSRDEFARLRISDYEAAESATETARHVAAILRDRHDTFQTRHRTRQGDIRVVLVTAQIIELSGQPVIHCIFRDVTQLHEQTALARLGEMAAVVAHEIKNPLAGVRGAIQVIAGQLPAGSEHVAVTGEIVARIDALDSLLQDMLLFARPPQLRTAPLDLVALAHGTARLVSRDPAAHHVRVEVVGEAPTVIADAKLLNIVLLNLLLNAAHAMGHQGTIRVSVSADERVCRLAVADEGPGIPPEIRAQIFTPFFTTKSRGTGLGLPTAKQLVEAHQGRVVVACPPAGGTVVTIELPLRSPDGDAVLASL